jgi:hypothetical protein
MPTITATLMRKQDVILTVESASKIAIFLSDTKRERRRAKSEALTL